MLSLRIKAARKRKKLTQDELAKLVNTTKGTISNYENNHSSPPNEMLNLLADKLETTTDYLLGRTDNPNSGIERKHEGENLFFFDEEDITPEEMEELRKHLEFLRYKAAQENSKK
ncbi:helix-turn-helix domain-containing protein [Evansella clarkii]|uniref:helix-turn-helix domain-containing protein n=1 Tax=Evansella clarkii TaxID=79879 RepID=UPI000B441DE3|nr:helix-turn-helix transcriptional regulator [Evansella clarkii]